MDMNDLDTVAAADSGATMTVRHPVTGDDLMHDGKPMTLTVLGADSGEFKRAVSDSVKSRKPGKAISVAEAERATIDMLGRITTGMSENWTWDKKPFPFSKDNVKRLYTERPWIRTQVDEFIAERSNFLGNS